MERKTYIFIGIFLVIVLIIGAFVIFYNNPKQRNTQFSSTLDSIKEFAGIAGSTNILTPQDVVPDGFYTYDITIDNGVKIFYKNYSVTFQPLFVMDSGQVYTWSEIPASIEKNLWKTRVSPTKIKYGVDFNNVSANVKDNLKYVVMHRTDVQNLNASDFVIDGNKVIIV